MYSAYDLATVTAKHAQFCFYRFHNFNFDVNQVLESQLSKISLKHCFDIQKLNIEQKNIKIRYKKNLDIWVRDELTQKINLMN